MKLSYSDVNKLTSLAIKLTLNPAHQHFDVYKASLRLGSQKLLLFGQLVLLETFNIIPKIT